MKKLIGLILATVVMLFQAGSASAISIAFVPEFPTVTAGDTLDVAIVISGLPAGGAPSVGTFDLDVKFDPMVLLPIGISFGPFLGDPNSLSFETITDSHFFIDVVDLAEVSLLSPTELDALQPSSFSLATLSFSAVGDGDVALEFTEIRVDDAFGIKLHIPLPGTVWLLMGGLVLLTWTQKRTAGNRWNFI